MPEDVSLLVEVVRYAQKQGALSIKDLIGCWNHQVDKNWEIWINGHREPEKLEHGPEVPPFSFYVEFNGFPAGILDAGGGWFAAGEAASEETFKAALAANSELPDA